MSSGLPSVSTKAPSRQTGMWRFVLLSGVLQYGFVVFLCWMLANRLETGRWFANPDRVVPQLGVSLVGGFVVGLARWMVKRRRRGLNS